jgi:hypothetical protein
VRGRLGQSAGSLSNQVLEEVDANAVISHMGVDALIARMDMDALPRDRINVQRLIDLDRVLAAIDRDALARMDL